ncbi:NUDIX domain-containing protein, partial [Candidatus Sumerlaeota bacterium]|nr:NUDIX domain-containing protein [Candidatus Sumerlaeota bacterium]
MVEPRKAAAGIIVTGDADPHVLLVRRSDELRFMPGHHAFPGGRIDDEEGSAHVIGAPDEDEAIAIHAVAREIFEETGLLCAEGDLPPLDEIHSARKAMLAEKESFDRILERFALVINPE